KPGSRFTSDVCTTEVIVVKGAGEADLRCGGVPMASAGSASGTGTPVSGADGGTLMGKRYVDAEETVEVLCTKPGDGSLGLGDTLLDLKEAKPLPASD
ncbi:MAG TPA: hypothetical protein DGK99_04255, partial [Acidimicrobiaceae bacterium]|nr:hypothetical protein [Acidimicrobiaceae bacterium]